MASVHGAGIAETRARVGLYTQAFALLIWNQVRSGALHAVGLGTSAVLYATSQPPYAFPWLAPVALVPWLFVVSRQRAAVGALSGFTFVMMWGILSNAWVPSTLELLGSSAVGGTLGGVLVVLAVVGLPWIVIGAVAAATGNLSSGRRVAALAAAFFAIGATTHWRPGGIPWQSLGHSQVQVLGVAQLAALGGVPLISGLVAAVNTAVAALLSAPRGRRGRGAWHWVTATAGAYGAAVLLGLPAAQWARAPQTTPDPLEILVVQPNLPHGERWVRSVQRTNLAIVSRQTAAALSESPRRPDLVVWPETVLTNSIDADDALRKDLSAWVERLGMPVILGAVRSAPSGDPSHYRNSVLRVDPEDGIVAAFDKTWAIPGVESAAHLGQRTLRAAMGLPPAGRSLEEGRVEHALRGSPSFAVAVCFEALFSGLVAARRDADTAAILVLANDSWFASEIPSRQHLSFASFRAIEQRLWLVRASLNGISALVDPYGRRVAELPFELKGTLRASVSATSPPGPAEKLVLVLLLLTGGALGWIAATAATRRLP